MIELKSKEKKNPEVCSIHKALLCFCSPYHDRLLNGNFSEALYPPTEPLSVQSNVGILQLFSKWLYTGSIHVTPPPSVESCVEKWFSGTTKLYVLADELNCVALQRAIISAQVKFSKNMALAGWEAIELLSDSSLESSGLYQYHVEAFAQHWNGKTEGVLPDPSSETDDPMPPNFAYRLLMKRMEVTSDRRCACCRDPCKFHGHTSEEERKASAFEHLNCFKCC